MWANSVWGLAGGSITFTLAAWGVTDPMWQTILIFSAAVCGLGSLLVLLWPIRHMFFPRPEITTAIEMTNWQGYPYIAQWRAGARLKRGWLFWINTLGDCRLYLIRKDWGPLDSQPEGIWLKWIEDGEPVDKLEKSLTVGRKYQTVMVARDDNEGTAYIANERFIETGGIEKKWELKSVRDYEPGGIGRYTFTLEIGRAAKRWRSNHYYAVYIPPAGAGDGEFKMDVLREPRRA